MVRVICMLIALFSLSTLVAQNRKVDSLYLTALQIKNYPQRLDAAIKLIDYISSNEREPKWLKTGIALLHSMEKDFRKAGDVSNWVFVWTMKAKLYHDYLMLDSSIWYAEKAYRYYDQTKDTSGMIQASFHLWSSYRRIGRLNTALQFLFKRLEIFENRRDTAGIIDVYKDLAIVYVNQEKDPYKILDALFIPRKYGIAPATSIYNYIAEAMLMLNMPDSAAYYLNKCSFLANSKEVFQPPYYFKALAKYHKYMGNLDSAKWYFKKTINALEKARQFHNQSRCYFYLGEIALSQNRYKEAEFCYKKAEFISRKYIFSELPHIYRALIVLYERQRRLDDVFLYFKKYDILSDSIQKLEAVDITQANKMKYEFSYQQEESKRNILKKEFEKKELIRRQREFKIGAVAIISLLIFFSFYVMRSRKRIIHEKKRSDTLLLNILPLEVANELKVKGYSDARDFDNVSVLFTDFVNFTGISEQLSPVELVSEIHRNFTAFDAIIEKHGLEKIKTIGDAYLAVCGLPIEHEDHASRVVAAALDIQQYMAKSGGRFNIRIGIHSGPVIAGIVGVKKYAYDIWGDTVNTAARMEQNSESGKINISAATYELIKDSFTCEYRGKIKAKNKGEIDMYFVLR